MKATTTTGSTTMTITAADFTQTSAVLGGRRIDANGNVLATDGSFVFTRDDSVNGYRTVLGHHIYSIESDNLNSGTRMIGPITIECLSSAEAMAIVEEYATRIQKIRADS